MIINVHCAIIQRLQEIEHLEPHVSLQQLWLGRNRIAAVTDGLRSLTSLRQLSLQANRLESISGLETLTGLEELYLSQNGIQHISGLESLTALKVLDIAYNPIEKVSRGRSMASVLVPSCSGMLTPLRSPHRRDGLYARVHLQPTIIHAPQHAGGRTTPSGCFD